MPNQKSDRLITERLTLELPANGMAACLLAYRQLNRDHLLPSEPERPNEFYTIEAMESQLDKMRRQVEQQSAAYWLIYARDSEQIIGECSFTNIIRGPFQACHLGFSLGGGYQGVGLMHEALATAISHIFEVHKLHRIMANYQPTNHRSEKLLCRLGFEREGLAKKYLKINGHWVDHVLTSLINPHPLEGQCRHSDTN